MVVLIYFFVEKYIQSSFNDLDIFCADGAYEKINKSKYLNSKVKKVIGDFDSFAVLNDELFLIDKDQYSTDFEKSLEYIISLGVSKIYVFGASEGEMDHFLCNITIAKNYMQKIEIEFIDIYSRYFFIPKNILSVVYWVRCFQLCLLDMQKIYIIMVLGIL